MLQGRNRSTHRNGEGHARKAEPEVDGAEHVEKKADLTGGRGDRRQEHEGRDAALALVEQRAGSGGERRLRRLALELEGEEGVHDWPP